MFTTLLKTEYKSDTKEVQISLKVCDTKVDTHRIPLADWRVAVAQIEAAVRDAENG